MSSKFSASAKIIMRIIIIITIIIIIMITITKMIMIMIMIISIIIIFANLFLIFHHGKMSSKEMADEWRTAVVACLVLFIMIKAPNLTFL